MSTMLSDCKRCGRPFAKTKEAWLEDTNDSTCARALSGELPPMVTEQCDHFTITRLTARVAELELIVGPRLRVWELSGGDVWVVALTEDECWEHLEGQHGNADEIAELKEDGSGWTPLPDDKKITMMVDEDGDVCGYDDGAPCNMPCWVWAVRHGAGFLGETE